MPVQSDVERRFADASSAAPFADLPLSCDFRSPLSAVPMTAPTTPPISGPAMNAPVVPTNTTPTDANTEPKAAPVETPKAALTASRCHRDLMGDVSPFSGDDDG